MPTVLSNAFGDVENGVVNHSGYFYKIFLPDMVGAGVPEAPTGGADAANFPDPQQGGLLWCCYAWPEKLDSTGTRVFFINQQAELFSYDNGGAVVYSGVAGAPPYDAAFAVAGDMSAKLPVAGAPGSDMNVWVPVQ